MNIPAHFKAVNDSLNAAFTAFDASPLDPYAVAYAVGMERAAQEREAAKQAEKAAELTAPVLKTPSLLGCYVNGKLRFQSRDHEAIHEYAQRHMNGAKNFGNDVWVTPVGSFITAEQDKKNVAKKLNKVHKSSKKAS